MKVGLHRLKGGSTQVDPCAHANAAGQQLGAIRAQNYRYEGLVPLEWSVLATRYLVQASIGRRVPSRCNKSLGRS